MFCRSLFVLLYFFFWPLCCLFFDIRILIAPLVSSNSSWASYYLARHDTRWENDQCLVFNEELPDFKESNVRIEDEFQTHNVACYIWGDYFSTNITHLPNINEYIQNVIRHDKVIKLTSHVINLNVWQCTCHLICLLFNMFIEKNIKGMSISLLKR